MVVVLVVVDVVLSVVVEVALIVDMYVVIVVVITDHGVIMSCFVAGGVWQGGKACACACFWRTDDYRRCCCSA